jgi:phytoene dehydrogenase-like protein
MNPLVAHADELLRGFLAPFVRVPRDPFVMLRLGLHALLRPATTMSDHLFTGDTAKALFAGNAAHAVMPLDRRPTGAFGLIYSYLAHAYGWPMAKGGSHAITDALGRYLWSIGGEIECGRKVERFTDLPRARAYLFDVTPKQLVEIAGDQLSFSYKRRLGRYRYGPAVCKLDLALNAPIPWKDPELARVGTLHLGGSFDEIAASEAAVGRGEHSANPWVIVAQHSLFDPTRAPEGKHTVWAYCHVPNGSTMDMSEAIENQIERYAPGFRDVIAGRAVKTAMDLAGANDNLIGGDIACGVADVRQLVFRPVLRLSPYSTPHPGIFLCSSSTPPGPGVHGMCGYWAARAAVRKLR